MTDARSPIPSSLPRPHRVLGLLAVLLGLILAGLFVHRLSERSGIEDMRRESSHQLDVLAAAIDSEVMRHAAIPSAVQLNLDVMRLLRTPPAQRSARREAANRFLQQLNDHLGGPAIFVMDVQGRVVASSDWLFSDNLLDADLTYMPFFRSAAAGAPTRHYAIDHVRHEPGYYFALPIRDEQQDWRVIGIAVVKSGIRELERRWLSQEAPAVVVDNNGIVLLSSPPEWRYASLQPLPGEALVDLSLSQFGGTPVGRQSLDIALDGADEGIVVRLPKRLRDDVKGPAAALPYLALSRNLPGAAWRVVVFSELRPVEMQAMTHAALTVAALGCLCLGALYLNQRRRLAKSREEARRLLERSHHELERKVEERTADLSEAVGHLQREVAERQRAEQTLRAAQDELVQAAKLAVVGQMATGITHELSQPLGAIRTLSENAAEFMRRGELAVAERNLGIVGQLTVQMGNIIGPLKTFARKSPAVSAAVDVGHAIDAALFLFEQRLKKQGVAVVREADSERCIAWCDGNRLQQVLVNLIGNALDALDGRPEARLAFAVGQAGGRLAVQVDDNGPGFSDSALAHLFEPFFTTKPPGEGLGLGLTISRDILRDFGGDLQAAPAPGGGARFTILLPEYHSAGTQP